MASSHFVVLAARIFELKVIYLDGALASFAPTIEQQEMARAFQIFAHAELEWFVERICIELSEEVLREASRGNCSTSTLALLTFASMEPLNGGDSLGGKKGARSLQSRVGDAVAKHKALAEANDGIREKHLAKLFVPLGLSARDVDSSWFADLDSFCSSRGAFAHMSRSESRASHLGVNPTDVWQLCERLVWGVTSGPRLSSFQELDVWVSRMKAAFSSATVLPARKSLWERLKRFLSR